jgi:DNA-binding response OmpR family regulator
VPRPSGISTQPHAHSKARALDILVMEDDPALGELVRDALRRDGNRVLLLENGLLAMAHLHAKLVDQLPMPDLIVADAVLPGFKGLDIVASLRRAGCALGVIMVTSFASDEMRAKAGELGAIAVLDKPFDLDTLRTLVASRREAR